VGRQLGEVVELAPVQDALAVGLGVRQHARAGPGGEQYDVGLERADLAVDAVDAIDASSRISSLSHLSK